MMVAQDCERGNDYLPREVQNRNKKQTLAATFLDFVHGFVGAVYIVYTDKLFDSSLKYKGG